MKDNEREKCEQMWKNKWTWSYCVEFWEDTRALLIFWENANIFVGFCVYPQISSSQGQWATAFGSEKRRFLSSRPDTKHFLWRHGNTHKPRGQTDASWKLQVLRLKFRASTRPLCVQILPWLRIVHAFYVDCNFLISTCFQAALPENGPKNSKTRSG